MFDKFQIAVTLNPKFNFAPISLICIEIGYENNNSIEWKSNARVFLNEQFQNYMENAVFKDLKNNNKTYVFDYYTNQSQKFVVKIISINSLDNSEKTIEKEIKIENQILEIDGVSISVKCEKT